jgi:hypothetical protein
MLVKAGMDAVNCDVIEMEFNPATKQMTSMMHEVRYGV